MANVQALLSQNIMRFVEAILFRDGGCFIWANNLCAFNGSRFLKKFTTKELKTLKYFARRERIHFSKHSEAVPAAARVLCRSDAGFFSRAIGRAINIAARHRPVLSPNPSRCRAAARCQT
jgi:hypothetical protein